MVKNYSNLMFSFLQASVLLLSMQVANAASTGTGNEVANNYNIQMWYNTSTSKVNYEVVIPDGTWFALMIGSTSMTNSDIVVFQANGGSSAVTDTYSTGWGQPGTDPSQDVTSSFTQVGSEIKFTAARALDTGDASRDYLLVLD